MRHHHSRHGDNLIAGVVVAILLSIIYTIYHLLV